MPEILSLVRSSLLRKPVVGLGIVMVPGLSCEHTVSGEQRSNPSAVWEMVPGTSEGFDVPASISTHPPPLSVWSRVGTLKISHSPQRLLQSFKLKFIPAWIFHVTYFLDVFSRIFHIHVFLST